MIFVSICTYRISVMLPIELAVRDQVLTHVTPHIGFFLSAQLPVQKPEESRD